MILMLPAMIRVCLFTLLAAATLRAQTATPPVAPAATPDAPAEKIPRAEPVTAAPTPTPTPAEPTPTPAPTPQPPTEQEMIDAMSKSNVQEALRLMKSNYINSQALSEDEVYRATLAGFLERLGPGVQLLPSAVPPATPAGAFQAEILDDRIGYLRLGSLDAVNIAEMDAALENFKSNKLGGVILDLRATAFGGDFEQAAEVAKRFSPKGKMLFTVKRPSAKQERIYTSNQDPVFRGLMAVVVDDRTGGAAEVLAAALRARARAMIVGEQTAGQAVEYTDLPLPGGQVLRVAVAEVTFPDQAAIYPDGLKPDVSVEMSDEEIAAALEAGRAQGMGRLVFETERARMNEAALVARTNPEIDALEEALRQDPESRRKGSLRDVMLQRAVDLLTTLAIYEKAGPIPVES